GKTSIIRENSDGISIRPLHPTHTIDLEKITDIGPIPFFGGEGTTCLFGADGNCAIVLVKQSGDLDEIGRFKSPPWFARSARIGKRLLSPAPDGTAYEVLSMLASAEV